MSGENTQTTPEENDAVEQGAAETAGQDATLEADVQGFAADDQIAKLEADLAEMKNKWLRAVADEQNVRRRAEKEKQDALKYGVTNFAREMVSVADNLRRALASMPDELKDSDVVKGVEMTERELQNAFSKAGIKRVEAQGKPFDHNLHQAMFEIEDPSQPAGLVAQVMQDGYVIHDRLLRPAMVGVTKGGPKMDVTPVGEEAPVVDEGPGQPAYEEPTGDAGTGSTIDQET
ncbi:nucleotide exchange factor GrpE [Terasakiella pusilla]|uniref:nucleotide exchange factor GrpE n=1 Tax=Terasakiella pusilla TaxID=64973 RepID=UPI000A008D42|nr:nucleotide exchange factor GrpE [Terasakiella pusilla]